MTRSERQEAGTPQALFATLHAEYRFTIDVCASHHNAKLHWYLTEKDDCLKRHWCGLQGRTHIRIWCNPPYGNIPAFLAHAFEPEFSCYLLPVRTDRIWWMNWKPKAETHWFVGEKPHRRIQFEPPPGITYSSNPSCHCLFLFGKECIPGKEVWRSGRTGERL